MLKAEAFNISRPLLSEFLYGSQYGIEVYGTRWHLTTEIFVRKDDHTIYKVAQLVGQLLVVEVYKFIPLKVGIAVLGQVAYQRPAQGIHRIGEVFEFFQVFVLLNPPATALTELLSFEIQELVGWHIDGQIVIAMGLEHSGEDDTVENNIVLTDKVNQLRIVAFPVFLPVFALFFGPLPGT